MTLNGVMDLILRYFTEVVQCRRKTIIRPTSVSQCIFDIVYDHINTICAIIQRLFEQNNL